MHRETVAELLDGLRETTRGLTFLKDGGEDFISYAKLRETTQELSTHWSGLGCRPGDRVVLVVADEQEFVLAFLSAIRAGVIPVPLFPPFLLAQLDHYSEGLRRVLGVSGARLILTSETLLPLLADMAPCPMTTLHGLAEASGYVVEHDAREDDPVFLQFTSGSTGEPKGVVVTHRSLLANASAIAYDGLEVDGATDRGFSWLPLYHDMGLIGFLFVPLLAEASTVYLPPLEFAKRPFVWLEEISKRQTTISFAPNFAYSLLTRRVTDEQLRSLDLSHWRVAGCGAEPVRSETLETFAQRFSACGFRDEALMPCYGLAEATLAVALTPVLEQPRRFRLPTRSDVNDLVIEVPEDQPGTVAVSCGRVLPGHEVRIVDPNAGRVHGDRQLGEVHVRGPSLSAGYWDSPGRTAEAFVGGWLRTGDVGFVDGAELYVVGRIKDLIIANGRNYQPQDVEWAASTVEGVRHGNVVAFSSRNESDAVRVVLEIAPSAEVASVSRHVARAVRELVGLRVEEVVVVARDGIPKTTSGKLRRQHTRTLLESDKLPILQEA